MSEAIVVLDNHFFYDQLENVYSKGIVNQDFLAKYTQYYDKVIFLARAKSVNQDQKEDLQPVIFDNESAFFFAVPMFRSVKELVTNFPKILKAVKKLLRTHKEAKLILRVPSLLSSIVYFCATEKTKRVLVAEVVVDLSVPSPKLSKFGRIKNKVLDKITRHICSKVDAASYVTKYALQEKYPAENAKVKSYYSSVDLRKEFYYQREVKPKGEGDEWNLLHVSTLNQTTKGHDLLLNLGKKLIDQGYKVKLNIVGGGSYKAYYQKMAEELGIKEHTLFYGNISDKNKLRDIYIANDLMVFPTEYEGLPRVLIEAMACGLPCIASNVNGIPELLSPEDMFAPHDFDGFYRRVLEYFNSFELNKSQSIRNFEIAQNYEYGVLQERRKKFFEEIDTIVK